MLNLGIINGQQKFQCQLFIYKQIQNYAVHRFRKVLMRQVLAFIYFQEKSNRGLNTGFGEIIGKGAI